jgi:hypothetical protein
MENSSSNKTQHDKFKEAARQLETDDDEERFNEKLGKLVKSKAKNQGDAPGSKD